MTPKEKAYDLFFKVTMISLEQSFGLPKTSAKKCALIAVDEIIDAVDWHEFEVPNDPIRYWFEVKREIKKL